MKLSTLENLTRLLLLKYMLLQEVKLLLIYSGVMVMIKKRHQKRLQFQSQKNLKMKRQR